MADDRVTNGMMGNAPTAVCVTDENVAKELRSTLAPRGMRVGNVRARNGVDVIVAFEAQLARHRDDIDAIVLSQDAVEHATGRHDALLRECIKLANEGIPKGIVTLVIDERHVINDRGVQALRKSGITVTRDAASCAASLTKTFRLAEPLISQDNGIASDGDTMMPNAVGERRPLTEKAVALGNYDIDAVQNDPFGDLRGRDGILDDDDSLPPSQPNVHGDDDPFDYEDDDDASDTDDDFDPR